MKKAIAPAVLMLLASACSGATPGPTSTSQVSTTSSDAVGPEILVSPEFLQGTIPGASLMLLVTLAGESASADLSAQADGGEVTVAPASIVSGEVAEVTVVADPTDVESDLEISISAVAGGGETEVSRTVTVLPWADDRGRQAREILSLFTDWLAENRPDLGIAEELPITGTFTAPMLLVVSHYTFWTEQWEIGLAWHVMVPPDDFAEIYLRSRTEWEPTMAFRLGSWQTALETGDVDIAEVSPPAEVVR